MKKQASVFFKLKHVGINPFQNFEDYYNADLDTVKKNFIVQEKHQLKKI